MSSGRMAGKVAVVTGGASGLGRASALRLVDEGAAGVVIADANEQAAERVCAEAAELGGLATAFRVDVSLADECEALADFAIQQYGAVDALVAAAGISGEYARREVGGDPAEWRQSIVDLPLDVWHRVLDVNLTGLMHTNRSIARRMISGGRPGAIVNITSMCSAWTSAGNAPYTVSKAGAWMLTKCLALELAQHSIRVNAVGPGFIETPMTATYRADELATSDVLAKTPLARFGQPEEIANAVLFLASDEASFLTGEILYPDGGFNAPTR